VAPDTVTHEDDPADGVTSVSKLGAGIGVEYSAWSDRARWGAPPDVL